MRHVAEPDRVLATVLFTDIVGSTERASEVGDSAWRETLDEHDAVVRAPARAPPGPGGQGHGRRIPGDVRRPCPRHPLRARAAVARSRRSASRSAPACTPARSRCGATDVGGIAVHIAARVQAAAAPGEVLVSRTVSDLVVGSGIGFADRGNHALKGVPDTWRLYAVEL